MADDARATTSGDDGGGARPRIVVCDDHTLLRQSLANMLADVGEVVGEAADGREALALIDRLEPDLAVLDVNMPPPDGLEVAAKARAQWPDMKIVIVTMHTEDEVLRRATEVGVDAYLTKSASTDEVRTAVTSVLSGGSWVSPSIATRLMALSSNRPDDLTDRERDVLVELAAGERIASIADRLFVSEKTVKNHLTSIYQKLGAETGAQAVAVAYRSGLVSPHTQHD
ncbi:response regulator [Salsipaludibacter albus]|uniref:response regulator n=1 Tax=Salsipaludibacter albus TaxID=2849650 RepID=UPI001EE3BC39|nr:response regulator transcription factor [Salsipaludibacter albus]